MIAASETSRNTLQRGLTPAIAGFYRALHFLPKNSANVKVIGSLIHFSRRTGILQFD
jgi:hypothetical protein